MSSARFCGLRLEFQPGVVFRPHPTSEQLVGRALSIIGRRAVRVADIGTGSGAIAVAIAVNAPSATVYASDTNPAAVAVARANVAAYDVAHRVAVVPGSLLEGLPRELDLVVANLPYLPAGDAEAEPDDPPDAVAAGDDGLALIRELLAQVPAYLAADGHVLLQYRGQVYAGTRGELARLLREIEHAAATAAS